MGHLRSHLPALLTLCVFSSMQFASCDQTENRDHSFKIPALGRAAYLGHLYNEVSDDFLDVSIFTRTIPKEFITKEIKPKLKTTFGPANTFREKIKLLNIQDTVAANVLSGLTQVEGSASFLNEAPFTSSAPDQVSGGFLQKCRTFKESLEFYFSNLKDLYNVDILNHKDATHVVTGIEWGADTVVQFTADHFSQTELQEQMKQFRRPQQERTNSNVSLSMSILSDIPVPFEFSQTPTQVYNLLRQIPQELKTINDGKGIPARYVLTPLTVIKRIVLPSSEPGNSAHEINEGVLREIISGFDEIIYAAKSINRVHETLNSQPNCLLKETQSKVIKLRNAIYTFKSSFQETLRNALQADRSGSGDGQALFNTSQNYKQSEFNADKVKKALSEFNGDLKRTEFCAHLKASYPQIEYVGSQQNLDLGTSQHVNQSVYVLFTKDEITSHNNNNNNNNEWQSLLYTFLNELNQPGNKLYIVDCNFRQAMCHNVSQSVIHLYRNGRLVSPKVDHVYEEEVDEFKSLSQLSSTPQPIVSGSICEGQKPAFIATATKSASVGCGGTIQLPSEGESTVLDFNLAKTNESSRKCLWTFDATQNNILVHLNLKITLLCQTPMQILDRNTLTFTEWYGGDTTKELITTRISSISQNSFLLSKYSLYQGFLSFNSNHTSFSSEAGAGFILRVDVLKITVDSTHSSSSVTYRGSIGRAAYSFRSSWDYSSIVINPQPPSQTTLTVDVDSNGHANPCRHFDSVDILEFGMDGVPKILGRLCGRQSAVSYKTENPVALLFMFNDLRSGRGVTLSWK